MLQPTPDCDSATLRPGIPRFGLIIRGDDAGSSETANLAIKRAIDVGTLKNVSVMVCGPAFEHATTLFRDTVNVCFGLHVTLNSEWRDRRWGPVSGADRCPSLVEDDGTFRATPNDHLRNNYSVKEAVLEARAQLDRMRSAGLSPVYLDEHMGVSWLPGLRDALADLARCEGLLDAEAVPVRPIRRQPGRVCDNASSLIDLIRGSEEGTYIHITHPDGVETREIGPGDPWNERNRDADRRLLLDPDLAKMLRSEGFDLLTYPEVLKSIKPSPSIGAQSRIVEKRIMKIRE